MSPNIKDIKEKNKVYKYRKKELKLRMYLQFEKTEDYHSCMKINYIILLVLYI
jgi:hypothetical protein